MRKKLTTTLLEVKVSLVTREKKGIVTTAVIVTDVMMADCSWF